MGGIFLALLHMTKALITSPSSFLQIIAYVRNYALLKLYSLRNDVIDKKFSLGLRQPVPLLVALPKVKKQANGH